MPALLLRLLGGALVEGNAPIAGRADRRAGPWVPEHTRERHGFAGRPGEVGAPASRRGARRSPGSSLGSLPAPLVDPRADDLCATGAAAARALPLAWEDPAPRAIGARSAPHARPACHLRIPLVTQICPPLAGKEEINGPSGNPRRSPPSCDRRAIGSSGETGDSAPISLQLRRRGTRFAAATTLEKGGFAASCSRERRGRDSNPRHAFTTCRIAVVAILWHLLS